MNKRANNLTQMRAVHTLIVGVDIAKKIHWARMLDGRLKNMKMPPCGFCKEAFCFSGSC
jgi:hypothetical protein